jgi:hypothetical protein
MDLHAAYTLLESQNLVNYDDCTGTLHYTTGEDISHETQQILQLLACCVWYSGMEHTQHWDTSNLFVCSLKLWKGLHQQEEFCSVDSKIAVVNDLLEKFDNPNTKCVVLRALQSLLYLQLGQLSLAYKSMREAGEVGLRCSSALEGTPFFG